MDIKIRLATPDDAEALLGIYSYYVENTPITYELVPPTVEDFRNRITKVLKAYPYLVADLNSPQSNGDINFSPNWGRPGGGLVGYCYASRFRERAAYDHCVEILYEELEKRLYAQGIRNLYASITASAEPSIRFHSKHGYTKVAHFHKCGRKFNQWLDMIWMEKILE